MERHFERKVWRDRGAIAALVFSSIDLFFVSKPFCKPLPSLASSTSSRTSNKISFPTSSSSSSFNLEGRGWREVKKLRANFWSRRRSSSARRKTRKPNRTSLGRKKEKPFPFPSSLTVQSKNKCVKNLWDLSSFSIPPNNFSILPQFILFSSLRFISPRCVL